MEGSRVIFLIQPVRPRHEYVEIQIVIRLIALVGSQHATFATAVTATQQQAINCASAVLDEFERLLADRSYVALERLAAIQSESHVEEGLRR